MGKKYDLCIHVDTQVILETPTIKIARHMLQVGRAAQRSGLATQTLVRD
jgi:hypothetical protein